MFEVHVCSNATSLLPADGLHRAVEADDALRGTASGFAGAFASIVSAGFAAAGASVYAFELSMSLAVVLGCFLFSSAICGVQAWRDRARG